MADEQSPIIFSADAAPIEQAVDRVVKALDELGQSQLRLVAQSQIQNQMTQLQSQLVRQLADSEGFYNEKIIDTIEKIEEQKVALNRINQAAQAYTRTIQASVDGIVRLTEAEKIEMTAREEQRSRALAQQEQLYQKLEAEYLMHLKMQELQEQSVKEGARQGNEARLADLRAEVELQERIARSVINVPERNARRDIIRDRGAETARDIENVKTVNEGLNTVIKAQVTAYDNLENTVKKRLSSDKEHISSMKSTVDHIHKQNEAYDRLIAQYQEIVALKSRVNTVNRGISSFMDQQPRVMLENGQTPRATLNEQAAFENAKRALAEYVAENRIAASTVRNTFNEIQNGIYRINPDYKNLATLVRQVNDTHRQLGVTAKEAADAAAEAAKREALGLNTVKGSIRDVGRTNEVTVQEMILSWRNFERVLLVQIIRRTFHYLVTELREAIETLVAFEKGIYEIRTISQENQASVAEWSNSVIKLASAYGVDLKDATEAFYQTLSNQVTKGVGNVEDFVNVALQFAKVTQSTATEAVDLLTSNINAFNMSAQDATKVAAVMFKTIELGRVRSKEIANTWGNLTGPAAALGVTMEELGASLAVITDRGVRADMTMTLLRNVIMKLSKPTKEMTKFLDSIGASSGQAAVQMYTWAGVMRMLEQYANGSSEEMAKLWVNIRAIAPNMILAGQGMEDFNKYLAIMKQGGYDQYMNAVANAYQSSGEKLTVELNKIKIYFADTFGRKTARLLLEVTERFGGLSEAVKTLAKYGIPALGFAAVYKSWRMLIPTFQSVGSTLISLGHAMRSLWIAGTATADLFGGMLPAGLTQTQLRVMLLRDTFTQLRTVMAGFTRGVAITFSIVGIANILEQRNAISTFVEDTKSAMEDYNKAQKVSTDVASFQSSFRMQILEQETQRALQYTGNVYKEVKALKATYDAEIKTMEQNFAKFQSAMLTGAKSVEKEFESTFKSLEKTIDNLNTQIEKLRGITETEKEKWQEMKFDVFKQGLEPAARLKYESAEIAKNLQAAADATTLKEYETAMSRARQHLQEWGTYATQEREKAQSALDTETEKVTRLNEELERAKQAEKDRAQQAANAAASADISLGNVKKNKQDAQQKHDLADQNRQIGLNSSERSVARIQEELVKAQAEVTKLKGKLNQLPTKKVVDTTTTTTSEKALGIVDQKAAEFEKRFNDQIENAKAKIVELNNEWHMFLQRLPQDMQEAFAGVNFNLPADQTKRWIQNLEESLKAGTYQFRMALADLLNPSSIIQQAGAASRRSIMELPQPEPMPKISGIPQAQTITWFDKEHYINNETFATAAQQYTQAAQTLHNVQNNLKLLTEVIKQVADTQNTVAQPLEKLNQIKENQTKIISEATKTIQTELASFQEVITQIDKLVGYRSGAGGYGEFWKSMDVIWLQNPALLSKMTNVSKAIDPLKKELADLQKVPVEKLTGEQLEALQKRIDAVNTAIENEKKLAESNWTLGNSTAEATAASLAQMEKMKTGLTNLKSQIQTVQSTLAKRDEINKSIEKFTKFTEITASAQKQMGQYGDLLTQKYTDLTQPLNNILTLMNQLNVAAATQIQQLNTIAGYKNPAPLPTAPTAAPSTGETANEALGGLIHAARGIFAPRGTDTVPAMLTPGEFVLSAPMTKKFLSQIVPMNYGATQNRYTNQNGNINVGDITVNVQGGGTSQQTAQDIARALRREIRKGTIRL